jgi:hypothetical protein
LFASSFVVCSAVAMVTIVARIWGAPLEKNNHLAAENPTDEK